MLALVAWVTSKELALFKKFPEVSPTFIFSHYLDLLFLDCCPLFASCLIIPSISYFVCIKVQFFDFTARTCREQRPLYMQAFKTSTGEGCVALRAYTPNEQVSL